MAVAGGRLAIIDYGLARITTASAEDGRVIAMYGIGDLGRPMSSGGRPPLLLGDTMVVVGRVRAGRSTGIDTLPYLHQEEVLRLDLGSGRVDVDRIESRPPRLHPFRRSGRDLGYAYLPFTPMHVWTVNHAGGATHGWGGAYTIVETRAGGDTLRTIRMDVEPLPISAEARRTALAEIRGDMQYAGAGRSELAVELPGVQPHIVALAYSSSGQLWVRRTHFERHPVFDIFDDGRFACSVRLEVRRGSGRSTFARVAVTQSRAYLLAHDDAADVPYISVYAFEEGGPC